MYKTPFIDVLLLKLIDRRTVTAQSVEDYRNMSQKPPSFASKAVTRYREFGFGATLRAGTRHMLRRFLNRLEIKDYGFATESQPVRTRANPKSKSKNSWSYWQKQLSAPMQPYIGLSKVAAARGDVARADKILLNAMATVPNNAALLEAYCRLALDTQRWGEAVQRWQMLEGHECFMNTELEISVVLAYLQIGEIQKADRLLSGPRTTNSNNTGLLRAEGLLAEAKGDWLSAAQVWRLRGQKEKSKLNSSNYARHVHSYARSVRALVQAGALDQAEEEAQDLVTEFPSEIVFLKLFAEVAIASNSWVSALERWQHLEEIHPAEVGAMPSEWVYRIGVDEARRRTMAIEVGKLRATGMLSLAMAIQSVDEIRALTLARQARKFYPDHVNAMTAQVLSSNSRHSAAIWWARRLIATSQDPKKYYPILIESLIKSSLLDECEAAMIEYEDAFGKDNVWLRAMIEVQYRRDDFSAMRDVMQVAVSEKLPKSKQPVSVMRWLYDMIRLHPNPPGFLPIEVHDLVLRTTTKYDGKFLSDSIGMLLDPARGDAAAFTYKDMIAKDAAGEQEIGPVQREEILQFFMRRREWDQVQALLELPLPEHLDQKSAKKIWNIVRNKIDIRLGEADVPAAEAVAVAFLDQLTEHQLDGYAMSLTHFLLARLPTSEPVNQRLLDIAQRLGFAQMETQLVDWKERYTGFDPSPTIGCADRKRCFIVGNAPSIADLPLHALEGEDIFCVNRGMRALDVGLPQPNFLVVADTLVYKNHAREIDADGASVDKFFVTTNCLWRKPPTVPVIPVGTSGLYMALAPFQHAPLHLHRGGTVVVLAAQIAHMMGYKEIYIIGVDLDYSGPVTHFYGGGRKETERLDNFRPGGSGTELVNLALASLQEVVAADGCKLYNAAPAGKLDMLERVNFHDVLGLPRPDHVSDKKEAAE